MSAPGVSVVVCAYTLDRWELLRESIESVERQELDRPVEIVLVIDGNDVLLERARAEWPRHTVVPNAGPRGLSSGRNTALELVQGEIVAFLDDDAAAEPGWLAALTAPFTNPWVVGTGGTALPRWPDGARQPAALPPELWWIVGCSFTGQDDGDSIRNAMGCNMAYRTAALRGIGGFDLALGRVGAIPIGDEETDIGIRLTRSQRGARIAFVRNAVVHHAVTAPRTRLSYVLERSYGEGLSKAALSRRLGRQDSLSRESAYATRVLPKAALRELARLRPTGLVGATAICGSLLAAGLGYARGSLTRAELMPATPMEATT